MGLSVSQRFFITAWEKGNSQSVSLKVISGRKDEEDRTAASSLTPIIIPEARRSLIRADKRNER
jgi:hypothetical protein